MSFFFFNDTATTEIYTLSLHDALPIYHLATEYSSDTHQPCSEKTQSSGFRDSDGRGARTDVRDPLSELSVNRVDVLGRSSIHVTTVPQLAEDLAEIGR